MSKQAKLKYDMVPISVHHSTGYDRNFKTMEKHYEQLHGILARSLVEVRKLKTFKLENAEAPFKPEDTIKLIEYYPKMRAYWDYLPTMKVDWIRWQEVARAAELFPVVTKEQKEQLDEDFNEVCMFVKQHMPTLVIPDPPLTPSKAKLTIPKKLDEKKDDESANEDADAKDQAAVDSDASSSDYSAYETPSEPTDSDSGFW